MENQKIVRGIEYKMPKEMANMYIRTAKSDYAKKHTTEYLCKIVNEEFGIKGDCVNVITF